MNIRTVIGTGVITAGVSIFALAGPASAHHPTYSEDCSHIEASGTDYPAGSHVQLTVDGKDLLNKSFDGEGFKINHPWDQTVDHTFQLIVTSPDKIGEVRWGGTQGACQPLPPTTTTPPTTPTTVPVATTVPTTAPVVTTVPAATTTPTVLATTTVPGEDTSIARSTPTTVCRTPTLEAPLQPGEQVCALPTTGGDSEAPVVLAITLLCLGALMVLKVRRSPEAA